MGKIAMLTSSLKVLQRSTTLRLVLCAAAQGNLLNQLRFWLLIDALAAAASATVAAALLVCQPPPRMNRVLAVLQGCSQVQPQP